MNARPRRLTVRRLMLAVAIVAALSWSSLMAWKWDRYRRLALLHEDLVSVLEGESSAYTRQIQQIEQGRSAGLPPRSQLVKSLELNKFSRAEEARAAATYRRAMARPWRTIEADVPGSR